MRRHLTALLVVLVGALGLVGATAAPAAACSCVDAGTGHFLRNADAVFAGTVEDTRGSTTYEISVDTVYQATATVTGIAEVHSEDAGGCPLEQVEVGGDYVFFADVVDGGLHADLCGGTAPATDDLRADVAGRTGRADTPEPGPVAHADWPGWLLPAGGALIGLALVGGLLRRRRT